MEKELEKMQQLGVVEMVPSSRSASPVVPVVKKKMGPFVSAGTIKHS